MIDIVCPSCEARYRLPDSAIGENGRRVSCSACGHAWLAYRNRDEKPLRLGPEAAADRDAKAAGQSGAAAARPKPQAVEDDVGADADAAKADSSTTDAPRAEESQGGSPRSVAAPSAESETGPDPRLSEDRAKQMAQIRSMLNEIKKPDEPGSESAPAQKGSRPRPVPVESERREGEEERDPLREKLEQYKRPGAKRRETPAEAKDGDGREHRGEKRGAGTALTGFLLVVLVVSIMATVYLLHPLIIDKVPEAEPAIREYVSTMDSFRVWVGEQVAALQAMIEGLIGDDQA